MKRFISLLRGINVSGKNRISMPDLRRLYESLSLGNARTYIQSGNVVFESPEDNPAKIGKKIEAGIEKTLGMDVRVIVRDQQEFKKVLEGNPFINDRKTEPEKLYVTFLSDLPNKFAVKNITAAADGGGSPQPLSPDSRVVIRGDDEGSKNKLGHNWHGTTDVDEYIISGKEIYLYISNGYGKTKFSTTFFERKLGVTATTRNWKTVKTLCEMAMQR